MREKRSGAEGQGTQPEGLRKGGRSVACVNDHGRVFRDLPRIQHFRSLKVPKQRPSVEILEVLKDV